METRNKLFIALLLSVTLLGGGYYLSSEYFPGSEVSDYTSVQGTAIVPLANISEKNNRLSAPSQAYSGSIVPVSGLDMSSATPAHSRPGRHAGNTSGTSYKTVRNADREEISANGGGAAGGGFIAYRQGGSRNGSSASQGSGGGGGLPSQSGGGLLRVPTTGGTGGSALVDPEPTTLDENSQIIPVGEGLYLTILLAIGYGIFRFKPIT